jgi:dihydrofolate reductase
MRRTVLIMTMSLDGYVVTPDGNATGNSPEAAELKRWKLDRISRAGAHIMGRVTYEGMASFWPESKDEYAAPMNDIPKVVFSKSLERADWPTSTIARGDLSEEIARLKNQEGGELIVWGGASFAQAMARKGLVDEYVIITRPIAYGGGKPLFYEMSKALELKLLVATIYDGGATLHLFEPK